MKICLSFFPLSFFFGRKKKPDYTLVLLLESFNLNVFFPQCAYNFPAMVLFVGAPGFKDVLYKTFSALASDRCPLVRATIASSLHELAKILDAASFNLTKTQISDLFGDNDITVLEPMVGNMVHVIDALAR